MKHTQEATTLLAYVIAFLQEEYARWGIMPYRADVVEDMVQSAIEAYQGGAR